jgi:predicted glycoside hydrolase/deacetylase ChbG (UPF0249 family)
MKKPLILCADDYALSPGVTRGILAALDAGRINATGAMTNRPFWKEAASDVMVYADRADIGLHLNFTFGSPLGGMAKLAPSGEFPKLGAFLKAARSGTLPREEIRAEITRQLDAFEDAAGRAPAFIDGHQHVQIFPIVRDALFDEVVRRGYAGKVWLRDSSDTWLAILLRRVEIPKALVVAWLARGFASEAARFGFLTNRGFAGFSAFDTRREYGKDFARYCTHLDGRPLIMCHPGFVDEDPTLSDEVTASREAELRFLLSDDLAKKLEAAGLELRLWSRM